MLNSKLITLIKTFSNEEIRAFDKFVRSPYFNTSSATAGLFAEIKASYPRFSKNKIDKHYIFSKIYGDKEYNDVLFRKLSSNLLKLAEEFLAVNDRKENKSEPDIQMINVLRHRSHNTQLRKHLKEAERLLDKYPYRTDNYYLTRYQVEYVLSEVKSAQSVRSAEHSLQRQIYGINNYYFSSALKLYSILAMYKHSLDLDFDLTMIEEIENYFSRNKKKTEQDIAFFFHTMQMFRTANPENEQHYMLAKEIFGKVKEKFIFEDAKYALYLLTNFCSMMQQSGKKNYKKDQFEILKMDAEISKMESLYLDANQYLNVVIAAAGEKQYQWARSYMAEVKQLINADKREDVFKYANAILLYEQMKFRDALDYLSTISPTFWQSQSYIKDLTIKIYFELGMYEEVEYQIDSYKHYIRKGVNIPKYMRERNELFIRFLQRIIRLKNKPDEAETGILESEIMNSKTADKKWLLSKL